VIKVTAVATPFHRLYLLANELEDLTSSRHLTREDILQNVLNHLTADQLCWLEEDYEIIESCRACTGKRVLKIKFCVTPSLDILLTEISA